MWCDANFVGVIVVTHIGTIGVDGNSILLYIYVGSIIFIVCYTYIVLYIIEFNIVIIYLMVYDEIILYIIKFQQVYSIWYIINGFYLLYIKF